MKLDNRTDIKNFIIGIENKFFVNDWKINENHLWPIIRINLYFYLIAKVEHEKKKKKVDSIIVLTNHTKKSIKKTFYNLFKFRFLKKIYYNLYCKFWILKIPNKSNIFVAQDNHRIDYRNSRFNRFFDPFIEKNKIESDYFYLEYDGLKQEQRQKYKQENVYNFIKALSFLNIKKSDKYLLSLKNYSEFLSFLFSNEITSDFAKNWEEKKIEVRAKLFDKKITYFRKLLKSKNKIKTIYVLCFYSEEVMALISAANQKGVTTIEMQHGPQSDIHMAYSSWTSLPESGYDSLPRKFWNWDIESSKTIKNWSGGSNIYSTEVVGNFWVNYWKNKNTNYNFKEYILYSLQTFPYTIEDFFPPALINCIIESKRLWFIRLHPRGLSDLDKIKSFLKERNVLEFVNIEEATFDPLPLILQNAFIHITYFSGTTIEADMFDVKTVFLSEDGVNTFPNLLKEKKAYFIPVKEKEFEHDFLKLIRNRDF